jgi:hypothetical protein
MFASVIAKAQTSTARHVARRPAFHGTARPAIGNQSALRRLGAMQAKLSVGHVDDPLEHEADRVADQVMRMPDPNLAIAASPVQVSRTCAACGEEESGHVQTKQAGATQTTPDLAPDSVDAALRGPGRPLDPATRAFFEPRFGRDFSAIRTHDDAAAAQSARDIGARAYTVGNRIVFADGALAPHQPAGQHLLAHELAHTAQQDAASQAVRRQPQGGGAAPAALTPAQQIEAARAAAWGRVFNALQKVQGIGPPAPEGREDPGPDMRLQARRLAIQLFGWDPPNMDQIADILGQMAQALMPGLKTTTAAASDKECGSRAGYVVGHTPPVVLCPAFFASSAEEKIRTMVHESAHIAGIGQPNGESYCGVYDCQTNCGGFSSADAWSHYVHCLSGQTADKPMQITAPAQPGGGAPGGGGQKP